MASADHDSFGIHGQVIRDNIRVGVELQGLYQHK